MRIRAAAFIALVGLAAGSCGSSITNPSSNTNQVFTGVMAAAPTPGSASPSVNAGSFNVATNGFTTVTFNSLSPSLRLFVPIEMDIMIQDLTGGCSFAAQSTVFQTTGTIVQNSATGIVFNNLTLAQGPYCVLLTDTTGQFTVPETYTLTVNHP